MRTMLSYAIAALFFAAPICAIYGETPSEPFEQFTGRITRNKVRLRLEPNLDCQIVKELDRDNMVVVLEEKENFFVVQPPEGIYGYIYRPYVIDGVVEGEKVNVRLEPSTDAPVIAQLNKGDVVNGQVCPLNSKWIEIYPPAQTKFFICKDYIEKIGDPKLMASIERRRREVNDLLNNAYLSYQSELQKNYEEINLAGVFADYSRVIDEFHDFPEQVGRAKELLLLAQEHYLQKKIAHLESKTDSVSNEISRKIDAYTEKHHLGPTLKGDVAIVGTESNPWKTEGHLGAWAAVEKRLFQEWSAQHGGSMEEFYAHQNEQAESLRGIVQPYTRPIKNKPGDFVLISQATRQPIAYLYSTQINLKELEGNVVTIKVSPRNNHHFAFPAYFVLKAE